MEWAAADLVGMVSIEALPRRGTVVTVEAEPAVEICNKQEHGNAGS